MLHTISYDEFQKILELYIRDVNPEKLRMQYRMNSYLSLFKKMHFKFKFKKSKCGQKHKLINLHQTRVPVIDGGKREIK